MFIKKVIFTFISLLFIFSDQLLAVENNNLRINLRSRTSSSILSHDCLYQPGRFTSSAFGMNNNQDFNLNFLNSDPIPEEVPMLMGNPHFDISQISSFGTSPSHCGQSNLLGDINISMRNNNAWQNNTNRGIFTPSPLHSFGFNHFGSVLRDDNLIDEGFIREESPQCSEVLDAQELFTLGQQMDFSQCYRRRRPNSRSTRRSLEADVRACDCLREPQSPVAEAINRSVLSLPSGESQDRQAHRQREIEQQTSDNILNSLFDSAYLMAGGNLNQEEAEIFASPYVNRQLYNNIPYQPENRYRDELPLPEGQCISWSEYRSARMIPMGRDGELIFGELHRPYQESEWNHELLYQEYRSLITQPLQVRRQSENTQRIELLKSKLKMLNRNPLIKYALASSVPRERKEELFNVLQSFTSLECNSEDSSTALRCRGRTLAQIGDILIPNPDNNFYEAIIDAAQRDFKQTVDRLNNGDLLNADGQSSEIANYRSFLESFENDYRGKGLVSINSCREGNFSPECVDAFSAYCKRIDQYRSRIELMSDDDSRVADDLDEILADDHNPDINTNEEFRAFNEMYCNSPRRESGFLNRFGRGTTFWEYYEELCPQRKQSSDERCDLTSDEDYVSLRAEFFQRYPEAKSGAIAFPDQAIISGNNFTDTSSYSSPMSPGGAPRRIQPLSMERFEAPLLSGNSAAAAMPLASFTAESSKELQESLKNVIQNQFTTSENSNPSSSYLAPIGQPSTASENSNEAERFQDMSQERRQEVLGQWQREFDNWRQTKGENLTPPDRSKELAMQEEIDTLKALLQQQQQITEQQYDMLNQSLAARERVPETAANKNKVASSSFGGQSPQGQARSGEENSRAPASIAELDQPVNSFNGGVGNNSISNADAQRRASTGPSAVSSTTGADSVEREEAKLVNLRRFSDGFIIVESSSSGVAQGTTPAITLPVSEEQYQALLSNPESFNLSQIEQKIPRELLNTSEEIILLLSNGQNPPLEVKVRREMTGLVYSLTDESGRDQEPVRRVYTRQALQDLTRGLTQ